MNKSKIISTLIAITIGFVIAFFINNKPESEALSKTQTQTSINKTSQNETEVSPEFESKVVEEDNITLLENLEDENLELDLTPIEPITTQTDTIQQPEKLIYMITLKTNKGDIELALDAEKAPNTVTNFIDYAKNGHYNGTIFHRVIKGFMIQGGGFEPGLKQKSTNDPIENEANNGLVNKKYSIAMARTNDPHSATAQFFINSSDNDFLNFKSESGSGWGYTVFGQVTKGQEVVDSIEVVATGNSQGYGDVPLEDIVIESVLVAE